MGEDRVVELRTHGVSGTPMPDLLADEDYVPADEVTWRQISATDGRLICRRTADGRDYLTRRGRVLEALHWGSATSGGFKALWAVFAPFALTNVALWTLPRENPAARERSRVELGCQTVVQLIGLLLTVIMTMQLSFVVIDLLAIEMLSRATWRNDGTVGWLGSPAAVAAAAVLILAALLALGGLLTRITDEDTEGVLLTSYDPGPTYGAAAGASENDVAPESPSGFSELPVSGRSTEPGEAADEGTDLLDGNPMVGVLRTLHGVAAALAVAVFAVAAAGLPGWAVAIPVTLLVLVGGVIVRAAALPADRTKTSLGLLRDRCGLVLTVVVGVCSLAVTAWTVAFRVANPEPGPPVRGWIEPITAAVAVAGIAWAVLCCLLLVASRHASDRWSTFPRSYRPWLRGRVAIVFTAVAIFLGAALGAGLARLVGWIVQARDSYPPLYDVMAVQWLFIAGVGLLAVVGLVVYPRLRRPGSDVAAAMSPGADGRTLQARVERAGINGRAEQILAGLAALVTTGFGAALLLVVLDRVPGVLSLFGALVLTALVVVLGGAMYGALMRPGSWGRSLGIVWDLASFWPREGHPIVPKSYAPAAIVDVTRRTEALLSQASVSRVVLCGHSQGSLIMYGAAQRLIANASRDGAPVDRLSLLTYGSQLQWAYGRAFPAWFDFGTHQRLMTGLEGRWFNLIRFTDPVGGPVLSWNMSSLNEDATVMSGILDRHGLPDEVWPPVRADAPLLLGNELWLADPPPDPGAVDFRRGHSNYLREPFWDHLPPP